MRVVAGRLAGRQDQAARARSRALNPSVRLEASGGTGCRVTTAVTGEIAAGIPPEKQPAWERFLAKFQVLPWSPEVSWHYGQTHRYLKEVGLLIGSNDLWIAATALAYEAPLVTRDRLHHARVPGLGVRVHRDD